MRHLNVVILLVAVTFVFLNLNTSSAQVYSPKDPKYKEKYKDLEQGLYVEIKTPKGEMLLILEHEKAPFTVAHFVSLAEGVNDVQHVRPTGEPFYDGIRFQRVVKNFMIQAGDTRQFQKGFSYHFKDEINTDLKHTNPGVLSMANAGVNTNGCEFFITHVKTPWLDGKHAVFGHIIKGQEVVNATEQNDVIIWMKVIRVGKELKKYDPLTVFNGQKDQFIVNTFN